MHHRPLFILQTFVIVIIGIVHTAALQWSLYWYYPWLDSPVHFLGGMWIALATAWILARTESRIRARTVVAFVAFFAISWELFEVWAGVPMENNFVFDTTIDLCMDALGGIVGFFAARSMVQSKTHGEAAENNPS